MVSRVVEGTEESLGRRINPTFGYYRQSNGWITVSPNTGLESQKYIAEGWVHLTKYGAFDLTTYGVNHPLEGLFMFGGAAELPVQQVLEMGLYINPPLVPTCHQHITQFHRGHTAGCWRGAKPVEFPQLTDTLPSRIGPFPCEFCDRQMPTRQAREQHQQVAHKEELGNLRTGRSLGDSLAGVLEKMQTGQAVAQPSYEELTKRLAKLEKAQKKQRRATKGKG